MPSYVNNGSSMEMRLGEMRIRDDREKQNENEYEDGSSPSYVSSLAPLKFCKHWRYLAPTEKLTISRSQPDLSRINKEDIDNYNLRTTSPRYNII